MSIINQADQDRYEKIEKLAELKEKGLISQEEFDQEKKKILSSDEKNKQSVVGESFRETFQESKERFQNAFSGDRGNANTNVGQNSDGKAIASMILGIISLIFIFTGTLAILGLIMGIVGLVLGISANKTAKTSYATAGIVLSIIGIVVCCIVFIAALACVSAAVGLVESYGY